MMAAPRQPRQRVVLDDGHQGEVSNGEAAWRGAKFVLGILNPVLSAVALLWLVPIVRQRFIKPIWVLLFASAATAGAVLLKAIPEYLFIYTSLWSIISGVLMKDGFQGFGSIAPAVGEWFGTSGIDALVGQLWLAVPLGLLYASIVALRRSMYHAEWRQAKKKATEKQVKISTAKLPMWPQKKDDVRQLADLQVLLGVDRETAKPFTVPAAAFGKHCFIDGPSGFGKTTDLITIMRGMIEAPAAQPLNIGLININMKPDPDITESIRALAEASGRKLHIVTENGIDGTTTYNPLRHGTPEEARNILIEAEALAADGGFSEAHYRRGGERYTLLCMNVLTDLVQQGKKYKNTAGKIVPWKRDLPHLARLMQLKVLEEQKELVSPELQQQAKAYFVELSEDRDLVKSGSGIRQRFASSVEGAAGAVLVEEENGLDLRSAILGGDIVLFNLDAARDAQAARQIGNLAIQDVQAALSELGRTKWHEGQPLERKPAASPIRRSKAGNDPVQMRMELIVVDEFSALGGTLLQNLFERARSNGGAVVLATQVAGVMEELSPAFKQSVLKNSNVKIIHQQDDDAEEYAGLIGTEKAMAETKQVFDDHDLLGKQTRHSGQGSLREVDQFIVHPNELKKLKPGEAIVFTKAPRSQHRVMIRRMSAKYLTRTSPETEAKAPVEAPMESPAKPTAQPTAQPVPAKEPVAVPSDPWAVAAATAQQQPRTQTTKESGASGKHDDWFNELPPEMTPPPED